MNDLQKELAETVLLKGEHWRVFPLQTLQSMAERWGVSRQTVNNWSARHDDFPQPITGLVTSTAKTPKLYPFYEVERYERLRGLLK